MIDPPPPTHVLIAVASRHQATRGIADAIAAGLVERGVHATVRGVEELTGIDRQYEAVVLGSAVYAGRWLHPARDFAHAMERQLGELPVWLFSSGPVGQDRPLPDGDPVDVAKIAERTQAVAHRVFAGRLETEGLGFIERSMVRALHAETGDFRDWSAIDAFAGEIAAGLRERAAEAPVEPLTVAGVNGPIPAFPA